MKHPWQTHFLVLGSIILTLAGCANEKAITGGPEDLTPPEIVSFTPALGALAVDRQPVIEIHFSEQMDRQGLERALQVWPRPAFDPRIKTSWRWIRVEFPAPLDSNETYLVTLDKSAQDLRKNSLAETFVLAFSTGLSLNAGELRGQVVGRSNPSNLNKLYLYSQTRLPLDSLRASRASYEFQPDDSGSFRLQYLAQRDFMCFYHGDMNRNGRIDGGDYFGRPSTATVFPMMEAQGVQVSIWPQQLPLERLKLLKAQLVGDRLLLVRVNQPIGKWQNNDMKLNLNLGGFPLQGATTVKDDEFALLLDVLAPLADSTEIWFTGLVDSSGWVYATDSIAVQPLAKPDTTILGIASTRFNMEAGRIDFLFNHPLLLAPDSAFRFMSVRPDTQTYTGTLEKISSTHFQWQADSVIKRGSPLNWEIETKWLTPRLARLPADSLFSGRFISLPADSLGGLELIQNLADEAIGILQSGKIKREFKASLGEIIRIPNLPAGYYEFLLFEDLNGDGRYNSGGLGPGEGAEKFWVYPDEVRIRARWDLDLGLWGELQ